MSYGIKPGYVVREHPVARDDRDSTDEYQDEVYRAARVAAMGAFGDEPFQTVIDLGCGSGYKLMKYFRDVETIGVEIRDIVPWLQSRYPGRAWRRFEDGPQFVDMVICADTIEHVLDPDKLLDFIEACEPRLVVFSTPERDLLTQIDAAQPTPHPDPSNGPPNNIEHVREWTLDEFAGYIGARFKILEHYICNQEQATQLLVARPWPR